MVPYRSAHLDGVVSELLVRSDHGVQKDPEAIREVRRILREHINVGMIAPGVRELRSSRGLEPAAKLETSGGEAVESACSPWRVSPAEVRASVRHC